VELPEAISIVRQHNRWRRDHDGIEVYDPKRLGVALDTICDHAETMGQLERELAAERALANILAGYLESLQYLYAPIVAQRGLTAWREARNGQK
jgi:hypothetical protein